MSDGANIVIENRQGVMVSVGNLVTEWYYMGGQWVSLGVDLTNYYTMAQIGSISTLAVGTTPVGAINQLNTNIGALSSLTTTNKTSLVNAVNEVRSSIPTVPPAVTVVDNLSSTSATSALSANQGRVLNARLALYQIDKALNENTFLVTQAGSTRQDISRETNFFAKTTFAEWWDGSQTTFSFASLPLSGGYLLL